MIDSELSYVIDILYSAVIVFNSRVQIRCILRKYVMLTAVITTVT